MRRAIRVALIAIIAGGAFVLWGKVSPVRDQGEFLLKDISVVSGMCHETSEYFTGGYAECRVVLMQSPDHVFVLNGLVTRPDALLRRKVSLQKGGKTLGPWARLRGMDFDRIEVTFRCISFLQPCDAAGIAAVPLVRKHPAPR